MKKLDGPSFKADVMNSLKNVDLSNFQSFEDIFEKVLDRHVPEKKKAIMKRSVLATKCRAKTNEDNQKTFKKQRNFCNRLYKEERKKYYENLDLRKITDNRKF